MTKMCYNIPAKRGIGMCIRNLFTNETKVIELNQALTSTWILSRKLHIKKAILDKWNGWYKNGNEFYFFKHFPYDINGEVRYVNELIGEKLCSILSLDSVHFEFAKLENKYGLASISFNKPHNRYYFMPDLYLPSDCANLKNLERIRERCKSDKEFDTLTDELSRYIAVDIYMGQQDRNKSNIQFRKDKTGLHIAPMYDFEASFISDKPYQITLCGIEDYRKAYPQVNESLDILNKKGITSILEEIEDERKIIIPEDIKKHHKKFTK